MYPIRKEIQSHHDVIFTKRRRSSSLFGISNDDNRGTTRGYDELPCGFCDNLIE
jgi:hypothetical protein